MSFLGEKNQHNFAEFKLIQILFDDLECWIYQRLDTIYTNIKHAR